MTQSNDQGELKHIELVTGIRLAGADEHKFGDIFRLFEKGLFSSAQFALKRLNKSAENRDRFSLLLEGRAQELQGNHKLAVMNYEAALAASTEAGQRLEALTLICHASARINLTSQDVSRLSQYLSELQQQGHAEGEECEEDLEIAKTIVPGLCEALEKSELWRELLAQLELLPTGHPAWQVARYRAVAELNLGNKAAGERYLAETLAAKEELDSALLPELLGLAMNFRCYSQVPVLLERLKGQSYAEAALNACDAILLVANQEFDQALQMITPQLINALSPTPLKARLLSAQATALEQQGRYEEAFAALLAMNALGRSFYAGYQVVNFVPAYNALALEPFAAGYSVDLKVRQPVFIIGFPRSGTTLLDTALETQDSMQVLSETGGMYRVVESYERLVGRKFPQSIAGLDEESLDTLRQFYFEQSGVDADPGAGLLVDKLPLNMLHIPLILRMFPGARFIFSARNPVDVCVSCFKQDFARNNELYYFSDLTDTFARCRDVLSLFLRYCDSLPLNILWVRYEELVSDFSGVMQQVFDFLEVTPQQDYLDFHSRAAERVINTASAAQVTLPVYRSSVERWRLYEDHLQEQLPLIEPLLERLGYDNL